MASKDPIPSPAQGVGPIYQPDGEKPTATVSKEISYENVHVLSQTPQLIALLTWVNHAIPSRYIKTPNQFVG